MSTLETHIELRGGVWRVRLTVPVELQRARTQAGIKKATDVARSLKTKDRREAKRLAPIVKARIYAQFESELAGLQAGQTSTLSHLRKPSQSDMESVAWHWVAKDLEDYEAIRRSDGPAQPEERERRQSERQSVAGIPYVVAGEVQLPSPVDMYANVAEVLIAQQSWDVLPGSREFALLCNIIRSGRATTLDAMAARDDGDYFSEKANPKQPSKPVAEVISRPRKAKPGESLVELWPLYLREKGKNRSTEDQQRKAKVISLFAEFVGQRRDIRTITKADAISFKRELVHFPKNASNFLDFKGKDFTEVTRLNRSLKKPTIDDKTVNNYLAMIGGYWRWLSANGYTSVSKITDELAIEIPRGARSRDSLTPEQLQELFALPPFTGCVSPQDSRTAGSYRINDWRFWVPVICLYTGARLNEISQLRTIDVREYQGFWCIHITDQGDGMRLKNKHSSRIVPLHPELIRLGILKYHKEMKGSPRLFPELKIDKNNPRYSTTATREWSNLLQRHDKHGTQHQFRHTFMDALRQAGFMDNEFQTLVGHKSGTTTELYGNLPSGTVAKRAEMVGRVIYPIELTPPR